MDYRKALALGASVSLPDLFAAAGAKFAFDINTVKYAVDLTMSVIDELEAKL
jgi:oligoendopeptidase F